MIINCLFFKSLWEFLEFSTKSIFNHTSIRTYIFIYICLYTYTYIHILRKYSISAQEISDTCQKVI